MKLCGQNIENYFFSTQSTLNEDDNNVEEQLNYINLQGNIEKLHDDGWKKFILLLLMFICLVLDVVCLSVLSFMLNI